MGGGKPVDVLFIYMFYESKARLVFYCFHHRITQDIFWKVYNNGYLLEDTVEQLKCQGCNRWEYLRFLTFIYLYYIILSFFVCLFPFVLFICVVKDFNLQLSVILFQSYSRSWLQNLKLWNEDCFYPKPLFQTSNSRFLADRFVEGTCPLCNYEVSKLRMWLRT